MIFWCWALLLIHSTESEAEVDAIFFFMSMIPLIIAAKY